MADFNSAIPYIQKSEGGLSRATTDTASSFPSPYTYNGKTGWHTNRGVTYRTFKSLASTLGYEDNFNNFIKMPDDIWLKIYKNGYWNPVLGDKYNSQPIANAIVDSAFMSGVGGTKKVLGRFLGQKGISANDYPSFVKGMNDIVNKEGEKKVFNDFIDYRKIYLKGLNQPKNEKGWFNRMEALRKDGLSLLANIKETTAEVIDTTQKTIQKNPMITVLITTVIVLGVFTIYKTLKA
jgi:lysozyme family protein